MRIWSALPLLSLAAAAIAQDVPEPAPVGEQLGFATEERRMTVPVSVAGAGPFRFIIDTGAQRTVISRELAATLGLARGRTVRLTAMTETSNVGTVMIPSLSVSTLGGERIEAPALEAVHMGAPGILGIDTLQGHALAIDFDAQVMAVTPSSKRNRRSRPKGRDEIVVQAKNMFGQLVVTDASFRGHRIRVILDTGSAVSMGNEALRRRVEGSRQAMRDIELTSVTGGKLIAGYTRIERVTLGDVTFAHLPVAFADAEPFRKFGLEDRPAILLGMDALRLFRHVNIDFTNREVRLLMPRDARAT